MKIRVYRRQYIFLTFMLYVEINYLKSTANYVFCTYSHCSGNSVEYMFCVNQPQRYSLKERQERDFDVAANCSTPAS